LRPCPASAQRMKPAARFSRPSADLPLFVIPHPLGFEIGPQTICELALSVVSAVSRLAHLFPSFRQRAVASLSGHHGLHAELSPSEHHSWSFADLRRDLRHACQLNRTLPGCPPQSTDADWFAHPGLLESSVPEFPVPNEVRIRVPAELSSSVALSSRLQEDCATLTTTRPALTCIMRWVAV